MILSLTLLMSTTMLCMWCPQTRRLAKDGWCAQNFGPATTKRKGTQTKQIQSKWIKFLQIIVNRMKYNPLTVKEIVEAQKANTKLKHLFISNAVLDKGIELQIIENKNCICNKGRLVIPQPLQRRAVMWYHHYLQHTGHIRLEERQWKLQYTGKEWETPSNP